MVFSAACVRSEPLHVQGGGLLGDLGAPSQPLWSAGAPQASAQAPDAFGMGALLGGAPVTSGGGGSPGIGAATQSLGAGLLSLFLCEDGFYGLAVFSIKRPMHVADA